MRHPAPVWRSMYAHDRRKHRHRCIGCNRIINSGEQVYMARLHDRGTKALHVACADLPFHQHFTYLDFLYHHAMKRIASMGWSGSKQWLIDSNDGRDLLKAPPIGDRA